MFCSSDIGWVLGHSFIIYGPLLTAIKSVLFEGKPVGTPSPDVFWEIIDRNKSSIILI
jgi:propionyl-CoA synthetase